MKNDMVIVGDLVWKNYGHQGQKDDKSPVLVENFSIALASFKYTHETRVERTQTNRKQPCSLNSAQNSGVSDLIRNYDCKNELYDKYRYLL